MGAVACIEILARAVLEKVHAEIPYTYDLVPSHTDFTCTDSEE